MSAALTSATWPRERIGEALASLAEESGLAPRPLELPPTPAEGDLDAWVDATAAWLGIETDALESPYSSVRQLVAFGAPALLRVNVDGEARFAALVEVRRGNARLIGIDRSVHTLPAAALCAALCHELEAPRTGRIDRLLEDARIPERRRARVRAALLKEQLATANIEAGWLLRLSSVAPVSIEAARERLAPRVALLAAAHAAQFVLWLVAWWLIGRGALTGHFDSGWLYAWALMLLTLALLRSATAWMGSTLSIDAARLIKRRLLIGALRIAPEAIRLEGAGQLLGRVLETQTIESLAIEGGMLGLTSLVELALVVPVLAAGAAGAAHALLLVAWLAATLLVALRYHRRRDRWTAGRIAMTNDLVERMVGHRTRLAQEAPERWHDGEDQALADYIQRSRSVDRPATALAMMGRGWLLLATAVLAPALVRGSSPAQLAIAIGGILLAQSALARLGVGLMQISGALSSWHQLAPLLAATTAVEPRAAPSPAVVTARTIGDGQRLLEAQELVFRYRPSGPAVVREVNLVVRAGERLLLEGASGSGKSTLAALLVGLRQAESGLLLLHGLDRRTLGADGWRRRIAAAPQFHENHVFTGTFSFNLLLGRRWPPSSSDVEEALTVCRELGLGALLERMPSGLEQQLGETGWQLSHGERSRLYIARALLQEADMVVFDESFAALDPETLQVALECVLRRARTTLVIAHI